MSDVGKLMVIAGAVLLVVGLAIMLLAKAGLPLGRLPGDVVYKGKNTVIYFPLATSIVLSVVLSVVLYVVARWRR
jgi:H+/Cl- antiporter ClcA